MIKAVAAVTLVGVAVLAAAERGVVRIGRTSNVPQAVVAARTKPFLDYLERKAPGYRFDLVSYPSDQAAVAGARRREVDFLLTTATAAVELEVASEATPLATARVVHGPREAFSLVGSVIFRRAGESDVNRLEDLRGKRLAAFNPGGLGDWIAAEREFRRAGLDPQRDCASIEYFQTPEEVAEAVAQGKADAGVLGTRQLPRFRAAGRFKAETFHILPPPAQYAELKLVPFASSTRLYPAAAFMRLKHVPETLAQNVAAALFEMPAGGAEAAGLHIDGWSLPMNYQSVHECLKELRLPPYTDYGKVTLWGALKQHGWIVALGLLALAAVLAGTTIRARALSRRLLRSETRLRHQAQMLAQTPDAVLSAGLDGRVTDCNPAAEELFGAAREELAGRPLAELLAAPLPGERWAGELTCRRPNGAAAQLAAAVTPMHDGAGEPAGAVCTLRDITEQKTLQEQLAQSQKMEAIGRLAGGIAHDFNNLLTVINGYCDLWLVRGGAGSAQIQAIRDAGEKAAALTQQLLTFSRHQAAQTRRLDLNKAVRDAAPTLGRVLGETVRLETRLAEPLHAVLADPAQIYQVILNLAVNARDAMPGGGAIEIATGEAELEEGVLAGQLGLRPGRYVTLSVQDSGAGIDERVLGRVFEPFFTTKAIHKGTGLGLSIVYGIARQSGGGVRVESAVGQGSTFTVYLPCAGAAPPDEEATPVADAPPQRPATILLVEDQAEVREMVEEALHGFGYRVLAASGAETAEELSRRHGAEIELLLTDVVMPGVSGPQLAERLLAQRPELRVLFISGYTNDAALRRGGAPAAFLQKPFTPAELDAAVRRALARA